jgi:hypothetical protein
MVIDLAMKKFDISQATAYSDFNDAEDDLAKIASEKKSKLIGRADSQMNMIVRKATAAKDYRTAVFAAKHRDEVLGLTGKVIVTGEDGGAIPMTVDVNFKDEDLKAIRAIARAAVKKRITGK